MAGSPPRASSGPDPARRSSTRRPTSSRSVRPGAQVVVVQPLVVAGGRAHGVVPGPRGGRSGRDGRLGRLHQRLVAEQQELGVEDVRRLGAGALGGGRPQGAEVAGHGLARVRQGGPLLLGRPGRARPGSARAPPAGRAPGRPPGPARPRPRAAPRPARGGGPRPSPPASGGGGRRRRRRRPRRRGRRSSRRAPAAPGPRARMRTVWPRSAPSVESAVRLRAPAGPRPAVTFSRRTSASSAGGRPHDRRGRPRVQAVLAADHRGRAEPLAAAVVLGRRLGGRRPRSPGGPACPPARGAPRRPPRRATPRPAPPPPPRPRPPRGAPRSSARARARRRRGSRGPSRR